MPQEVKQELSRIQKLLPEAEMKLVEPENLHLTLAFLSELEDFKLNRVKEILKEVKQEKFTSYLGGLGVFPSESFIRVVWISLEPAEKLKELNQEIISKIKPVVKTDERFESHVTLARVKSIKDKKEFMKKLKSIEVKPFNFEITCFTLKKSILTSKGPIYEDISKYNLL